MAGPCRCAVRPGAGLAAVEARSRTRGDRHPEVIRRIGEVLSVLATTAAVVTIGPVTPARADAVRDAQWHLPFLRVDEAHRISRGDGVVVAVIDTGVVETHPDLAGNVVPGTDLVDIGGDGRRDDDGHGTGMAGLIAAHGR